MTASHKLPSPQARELGELLRYWRDARGKSQLDLSLDSGLFQRHLSFIESGRSTPSRGALLDIAQALDIPLRERNTLMVSAGYAPIFAESEWSAPEMTGHRFRRTYQKRVVFRAFAKNILNCLRLKSIAQRSRSGVCIHVVNLIWRNIRDLQRRCHRAAAAFAFGSHAGHVEGVRRHAIANHFGQYFRAAGLGKLKFFHDQDSRTLANDEAIAVFIKWPTGVFWILVSGRERLHGGESADAHGGDCGLCPSSNHDIGVTPLDDAEGVANGVCARRAGRRGGLVRAPCVIPNGKRVQQPG